MMVSQQRRTFHADIGALLARLRRMKRRSQRQTVSVATTIVALGAMLAMLPNAAEAQQQFIKSNTLKMIRKLGVHLNTSFREPTDRDVSKGQTYGVSIGLSPGRTNGWRYPVSLNFFSENLHGPAGGRFATLRTRSILAGIGYGWHFGKLSTGASLQGGFAMNRVRPDGDVLGAFALASGEVAVDVRNAFLMKPQLKAEYFVTPKFTLRLSGDYIFMRPDITVHTPFGTLRNQWDASNFHANVGVGFYPFRK